MLEQWRDGARSPGEVIGEARERWLAGDGAGADPIATDVLAILATGQQGISLDDIPALLEWLATPLGDEGKGLERFGDYMLGLDLDKRLALVGTTYYGSAATYEEDQDFFQSSPDKRRLHRGVREEPESVWVELRAALCSPPSTDGTVEMFLTDLVEDLLAYHAELFIERLERVADDCPNSHTRLLSAHVGGFGGPAIERFDQLQQRLNSEATR